jgi:hypothetical protein
VGEAFQRGEMEGVQIKGDGQIGKGVEGGRGAESTQIGQTANNGPEVTSTESKRKRNRKGGRRSRESGSTGRGESNESGNAHA